MGRPSPNNADLRQLIASKQKWHYLPNSDERELGFRGWHERGYLPHFDAPNVTQLVTFNLADSFPVTRKAEWEIFLREPDESARRRKLESWLNRGCGECWLRHDNIAAVVETVLLAGHGKDYELKAWVIMPNHIHVVVHVWQSPLSQLVKKWKGVAARKANILLGKTGAFWQEDYWDTLIRDGGHFAKAIRYVDANPAKARLTPAAASWRWSSARRRDRHGLLPDVLV